ncbi:unnamed protein product, partial [Rotaria magnacalcarata]
DAQNPEVDLDKCGRILVVLKEYERVVIMRLARTLTLETKGPGLLFVLPNIDSLTKVDLRTAPL